MGKLIRHEDLGSKTVNNFSNPAPQLYIIRLHYSQRNLCSMDSSASALEKLKGCGSQGDFHGVIQLMQKHQNESVQRKGCGALKNLASNADNRVKIAAAGGIESILNAMKQHAQHESVQEKGCGALGNLAPAPMRPAPALG